MTERARRALEISALAALYVALGRLGQLAAIPPGHVTAIWPPSGIALGALLLRGTALWPGVFFGSFLVNVWAAVAAGGAAGS
ncbi:MAG TPA: MASE1 domain-containing protein, partial [Thermoanaerobaculia bacterium]|nr:MASE1 domain-containing protein [Thermoanaerobaculia bacterium]